MLGRSGWTSVCVLGLLVAGLGVQAAGALTVWYNGDMDMAGSGFTNRYVSSENYGLVYDDFVVNQYGWEVSSLWSNNTMTLTGITQAYWEIRSGVSNNVEGSLLFWGLDSATLTETGREQPVGTKEYRLEVASLNLSLSPGTYWLAVAPVLSATGQWAYISETHGVNAVGTPAGNNGQSFYDGTGGYHFRNMSAQWGGGTLLDYSMGIGGTPIIPEPSALVLLGVMLAGGAGHGLGRRLRRR